MPAQSSTAVVFRALVMLFFLVAIPACAMFGSSLPKLVDDLMAGHLPKSLSELAARASVAPKFEPVAVPDAPTARPIDAHGPGWQDGPVRPLTAWPVGSGEARASEITPAAYQSPVDSSPMAGNSSANSSEPRLLGDVAGTEGKATAGCPAVSPVPPGVDPFAHYQQRLRDLGAAYYLLEGWGEQQNLYRFFCKMTVGGNPGCTKHFEATDADPLRAMADVVGQVEAWRSHGG